MRGLATKDIPKAIRFLKVSGFREEVNQMFKQVRTGKEFEMSSEAGLDFLMAVISRFDDPKIEDAFCDFISGPLEITSEEVMDMDILALCDMLKLWTKATDFDRWMAFFTLLLQMMKDD